MCIRDRLRRQEMILEKETFEKFGYYSTDLKPKSNKKIVVICDDCGKVRILKKKDYCARCYSCAKKGDRNPRWKGGKDKQICEQCGIEFPIDSAKVKSGGGRFCSPECKGKWMSEYRIGENSSNWQGGKIMRTCKECGIKFPIHPSDIKYGGGKFCSRMCSAKWKSKHLRGENSPRWKGGISFEPYCHKFNEEFKEYIRDKFGRVCFLCPKTEKENGKRLSVHHVNYNKGCGCDDDETCQFVPLCISCNSKVNSNREIWEQKIKDMMKNKLNGWYI